MLRWSKYYYTKEIVSNIFDGDKNGVSMNSKVQSKWLFIDIIKIFAAFVLVVYHFKHLIIYDAQVKNILTPALSSYLYPLYKYGDFMVELLIVISGFTSAHAQMNKISEGTISLFDFKSITSSIYGW